MNEQLISLVPGKRPGLFTVRLDIFPRPVFIGVIEGDTFRKRVDPSKHVYHNSDSVAISAALLYAEAFRFRWIVVETPGGKLVTSRAFFLAHAMPHQFRNYEPQLFLPVAEFGIEKARTWEAEEAKRQRNEAEKQAQGSLFGDTA